MQRQQRSFIQRSRWQRSRWLGIICLIGCLGALTLVRPVHATDFRGGDTIVIDENQVIDDDLFIAGETVTIDGIVKGDLVATGETVTINGHVEGSLLISGRTLAINGTVNGSTYAGGYSLTLGEGAAVGRNLYFGGYNLAATSGSTVGRSLYGGGYQLLLNGDIAQDAMVGSAALAVNGRVGGDLRGTVGSSAERTPPTFMPDFEGAVPPVAPGLRISPDAAIGGALAIETTAMDAMGDVAAPPPPFFSLENPTFRWAIGEFLALLIIGLLLLYLRPTLIRRAGVALQERPLPSLGVGLLTVVIVVIGSPIALGLTFLLALLGGWLTLGQLGGDILGVGIPTLLFVLTLFFFVAGIVTKIVVAYMGGNLLFRQASNGTSSRGLELIALAFGLLIYMGLRLIPFGGGAMIALLVTLFGLGAFYFALRGTRQPDLASAPILPVAGSS